MGRVSAHVVSGMAPDARTCHDVPGRAPEVARRGGTPTCPQHPHFLRTDRARPPGCESGQVTPRVPRMRTGVLGVHRIPTSPHCTPGAPGAPREPEGRPLRPQSYRGTGPRPVRHRRPRSPCVPRGRSPSPACPQVPRTGPRRVDFTQVPTAQCPGRRAPGAQRCPATACPPCRAQEVARCPKSPWDVPGHGAGALRAGMRPGHRAVPWRAPRRGCPSAVSPPARASLDGFVSRRYIWYPMSAPDPVGRPDRVRA